MNKYSINIDWLEFSLHGNFDLKKSDGFSYHYADFIFTLREGKRTKFFKEIYDISYRGNIIADLCCAPHSKILHPDLMQVKLANRVLYEKDLAGLISEFITATGFKFVSVKRLDIAIDGRTYENGQSVQNFINDLALNQLKQWDGRTKINTLSSGGNYEWLRIGQLTSNKCIVIYNKTKELLKSNKTYIKEYHEKNVAGTGDIWRTEFRFNRRELVDLINPISGEVVMADLVELLTPERVKGLVQYQLNNFFKFKTPEGDPLPDVICLDDSGCELLAKHSTKQPSKIFRVKVAIKAMLEEYITTTKENYFTQCVDLIKSYKLDDYALKRLPFWLSDFRPLRNLNFAYEDLMDYIGNSVNRALVKLANVTPLANHYIKKYCSDASFTITGLENREYAEIRMVKSFVPSPVARLLFRTSLMPADIPCPF